MTSESNVNQYISLNNIIRVIYLLLLGFILYRLIFSKNQKMEHFMTYNDINSTDHGLVNQLFPVDNYYYLDNSKYSGIVMKDYKNLPTLRCSVNSLYDKDIKPDQINTYNDKIVNYFKKHIFPLELIEIKNDLKVVTGLLNDNLDIGIVNEEYLRRYIDKHQDKTMNFSVIGGLYYMDFYLIAQPGDTLDRLPDIKTTITVNTIKEYKYYLNKLVKSYQFKSQNPVNIVIHESLDDMIKKYMDDDINYMFIISHPLDKYLLKMSETKRIKLIHLDERKNNSLSRSRDGSGSETGTDERNRMMTPSEFYTYARTDLHDYPSFDRNNIIPDTNNLKKDTHRDLLRRYIPRIYPKVIDLSYFHDTDNLYTYLETYSIKYLLVARNDIRAKHIKILTKNLIKHLKLMRDTIIEENYIVGYQNHNNYDLKLDEILAMDTTIPLHPETKCVYEKVGLIKIKEVLGCEL